MGGRIEKIKIGRGEDLMVFCWMTPKVHTCITALDYEGVKNRVQPHNQTDTISTKEK